MRTETSKSAARSRFHASLDAIHNRFRLELDALHSDLRQLATGLRATNEASSRAGKDRIEGFNQALRDVREAAD